MLHKFKRVFAIGFVVAFAFVLTACGEATTYYESDEFGALSGYDKLYYYVTNEGTSEKELVGENKKLSDAVTSSIDDFTESWKFSSGSYSIRYAKLLDCIVLRVILDKAETKTSFEIFVDADGGPYEFSSTILYKTENIQCASTGVVPLDFSKDSTLELETLSGVESKYETYKKDSHNACAILLLNTNHHIKGFNFDMGDLGFLNY
ncbi:MAG: hypothetical protein J6J23_00530 [Clostridia bacterium]|nr:hypothetical protein [Clostridia bacterium]